jgi:membrane protease YdiL (CAAX protease family)
VWALEPVATPAATPFTSRTDTRVVAALCGAAALLAGLDLLPREAAAALGVAAIHGGLLAIALLWSGMPAAEAAMPIALLALARALVGLHPLGAVAYLAVPAWLAWHARAGRLVRLELGRPWPWGPTAVGVLAGMALALHLVACVARTRGYVVRLEAQPVLAALAYDIGANVVSAELFFRGALLHHLWSRWTFGLALGAASFAAALRYCLDPFVATTELRVGAAVYMTLLAVLNGLLCRWSGSLLPGLAAAAIFFACYRLLATA